MSRCERRPCFVLRSLPQNGAGWRLRNSRRSFGAKLRRLPRVLRSTGCRKLHFTTAKLLLTFAEPVALAWPYGVHVPAQP